MNNNRVVYPFNIFQETFSENNESDGMPFKMENLYFVFGNEYDPKKDVLFQKELQYIVICIQGICNIKLAINHEINEVNLCKHDQGIYIYKNFKSIDYISRDAILMVMSNEVKSEKLSKPIEKDTMSLNTNKENDYYKHPFAIVDSENIGADTTIWAYVHVLAGATIGKNCNINDHTFIENDVIIGDNVTVKSGVHIWDGIRIEDNVFIGPSVVFTNDLNPRSKIRPIEFLQTTLKKNASIGANSTIVAGNTIGEFALIGAGSVVTKDIPPFTLWYGNPAKFKGYICKCGKKLNKEFFCEECKLNYRDIIIGK